MEKHEKTIREHVQDNLAMAIDQAGDYELIPDSMFQWLEGDAYARNTFDSAIEDGYSSDQAFEADTLFREMAKKTTIRFA